MNNCTKTKIIRHGKSNNNQKNRKDIIYNAVITLTLFYCITVSIILKSGLENLHLSSNSLKDEISSKKIHITPSIGWKPPVYDKSPVLTAYVETIDQDEWKIKPLPLRKNAQASKLKKISYPGLKSCKGLPSQWPVDNYPDQDPFLPWIHDVFPSADGSVIHFVAQNKRRCRTGENSAEIKRHMQPQVSLFQHIPVKRILDNQKNSSVTRYRLASHEEADPDGIQTRFICRFKPNNVETLSTFQFDYNYAAYRKGYSAAFTEEGFDNHVIWTSQHMFDCPVPKELQEIVKSGGSIHQDYATMFLDLIPIRTPPRYNNSKEFLPPKYEVPNTFNATEAYGSDHLLPLIKDSGRWENIPICKPSLQTYSQNELISDQELPESASLSNDIKHKLVACTWTSDSYKTRLKHNVSNGRRRLKEWITFHLLTGFDHIYVYDNSGAFDKNASLAPVTDEFPSNKVTRIDWPSQICNNNPSTVRKGVDKGERSSQYAAEASCLLRFGPHTKWMSSTDTDEYLVPMGDNDNMQDVLVKAEKDDMKILTFKSSRSFPMLDRLEPPKFEKCREQTCFNPTVKKSSSILHTYNCDREKLPRKKSSSAEKQIFRTDYVLMHYIHYSTITKDSELSRSEFEKVPSLTWRRRFNEKKNRIPEELTEAVMLHTRSVNLDQTINFAMIGIPWPNATESNITMEDKDGNHYNCFINEHVDRYWVPKFHQALGFRKRI